MNPNLLKPNSLPNLSVTGLPTATPQTFVPNAPLVPSITDASKMQSATPLSLTPKTEPGVPNISNLSTPPAGWDTGTYSNFKQANPNLEPNAEDTYRMQNAGNPLPNSSATDLTARLQALTGQTDNKETDLASSIESATAPYNQQLNEINTQIKQLQASSIANQEKALNSGETTGFASREAQNVARTDAIQGLFLQAQAEGMRGNIALAETHTTNAINAKYADINKQIKEAKDNIYNNYDSFTASEKKKADQTLLRLDKDDATAKQHMEDDKITQGFIQEAIAQSQTNGKPIDTLTLKRANEAKTPQEALQILAPFMVDAQKKADALLDRQYKQAQISKLNTDIENTNASTKKILNDINAPAIMANLDTSTPEGRNTGNLLSVIASNKLDTGAKTQIANILGVINASSDLAKARPDGKFEGLNPIQGIADFIFPESLLTNAATENRGYLDAINLKVQQWASGASLTKQQTDQVNNLTPKKTDSDEKVRTKLTNLTNFMLTQAQSQLQSQGLNYVPEKVNLFETQDLLKGLSPEQEAELKAQGLIQ